MKNFIFPLRLVVMLLLITFDVYAISSFYVQNHHLPFTVPTFVEQEIENILPTLPLPSPTPLPLENNVELSQGDWIGAIVYGKLTNHTSAPLSSVTVRFSLSKTKDDLSVMKTYTATFSSKLQPDESVYFSQRFTNLPAQSFWWSSQILHAEMYTGQTIPKPPSGQKLSKTPIATVTNVPVQKADSEPWGVAKQIDDVTWTIKVGQDDRMATPQETFEALNAYRQTHGVAPLRWDDNLARFAQERAIHLNSIQSTDSHKGFKEYIADEENVRKLGFWSLGENSGYGNKLMGVHLIEWIYAADEGHNKNQLNSHWSHIGIGIQGLGVAFIFGGDKI